MIKRLITMLIIVISILNAKNVIKAEITFVNGEKYKGNIVSYEDNRIFFAKGRNLYEFKKDIIKKIKNKNDNTLSLRKLSDYSFSNINWNYFKETIEIKKSTINKIKETKNRTDKIKDKRKEINKKINSKSNTGDFGQTEKLLLYVSDKKDIGTARALSFICPGAGHFYSESYGQGIIFIIGETAGILFGLNNKDIGKFGFIGAAGLRIWEIVDAGTESKKYNRRLKSTILEEENYRISLTANNVNHSQGISFSLKF